MTWTPQRYGISNITRSLPAVITTAEEHGLTTGQAVRVNVPRSYGMYQISGQIYAVTVIDSTNFSVQYSQVPPAQEVDSRDYTQFVVPSNPGFTAEVLSVGALPSPIRATEWQVRNETCATTIDDAVTNNSTVEIPF